MYTNIHLFFTLWMVIMIIFHKYLYKYINLLYLSFITLIIGIYISYINPREFKFRLFDEEYVLQNGEKFIVVDLFFHILAFIYIYHLYSSYYNPLKINIAFLISLIIILVYSIMINVYSVYHIHYFELFSVFMIGNLIYLLIFD